MKSLRSVSLIFCFTLTVISGLSSQNSTLPESIVQAAIEAYETSAPSVGYFAIDWLAKKKLLGRLKEEHFRELDFVLDCRTVTKNSGGNRYGTPAHWPNSNTLTAIREALQQYPDLLLEIVSRPTLQDIQLAPHRFKSFYLDLCLDLPAGKYPQVEEKLEYLLQNGFLNHTLSVLAKWGKIKQTHYGILLKEIARPKQQNSTLSAYYETLAEVAESYAPAVEDLREIYQKKEASRIPILTYFLKHSDSFWKPYLEDWLQPLYREGEQIYPYLLLLMAASEDGGKAHLPRVWEIYNRYLERAALNHLQHASAFLRPSGVGWLGYVGSNKVDLRTSPFTTCISGGSDRNFMFALSYLGMKNPSIQKRLALGLKHENQDVRRITAEVLAAQGPAGVKLLDDATISYLESKDPEFRYIIDPILEKSTIPPKPLFRQLARARLSEKFDDKFVLGLLHDWGALEVNDIRNYLVDNGRRWQKDTLAVALAQSYPQFFRQLLSDDTPSVRRKAVFFLVQAEQLLPTDLNQILKLFKNMPSGQLDYPVMVEALSQYSKQQDKWVPYIKELLRSEGLWGIKPTLVDLLLQHATSQQIFLQTLKGDLLATRKEKDFALAMYIAERTGGLSSQDIATLKTRLLDERYRVPYHILADRSVWLRIITDHLAETLTTEELQAIANRYCAAKYEDLYLALIQLRTELEIKRACIKLPGFDYSAISSFHSSHYLHWRKIDSLSHLGTFSLFFNMVLEAERNRSAEPAQYYFGHYLLSINNPMSRLWGKFLWQNPTKSDYSEKEAKSILELSLKDWNRIGQFPGLQAWMAPKLADFIHQHQWSGEEESKLQTLSRLVEAVDPLAAAAIAREFEVSSWDRIKGWLAGTAIGLNLFFWIAFLFLYERVSWVRAVLIWNPIFRLVFGLLYVDLLFRFLPILQKKLFAPFRYQLRKQAEVSRTQLKYFEHSTVIDLKQNNSLKLLKAIPEIKEKTILLGQSGLGKTTFVHQLVKSYPREIIYLNANECQAGVLQTIMQKISPDHAPNLNNRGFLQSLIYAGDLHICIDGVNEVRITTRKKILEFVQTAGQKSKILLVSQPINEDLSHIQYEYELQPLKGHQIKEFLLCREVISPETRPKYEVAVEAFLHETIDGEAVGVDQDRFKEVLQNPMDLSLVADLLAAGSIPNLNRLFQQVLDDVMAAYQATFRRPFPLADFAQSIYEIKLTDSVQAPADRYPEEVATLQRHKVVRREYFENHKKEEITPWKFRHEKFVDIFIIHQLSRHPALWPKHLNERRFQNIYLQLLSNLQEEQAVSYRQLFNLIRTNAAQDGDKYAVHLSDLAVNLIASSKSQPKDIV